MILLSLTLIKLLNAALIRRQYRIKLPDAIISATAKYLSVPLVTADNIFKKVPDVDIILFDI